MQPRCESNSKTKTKTEARFQRGALALIAATLVVRLVAAATVGPGNDEAYHVLYAWHLDWSYFDHPPMLGWLGRLGLELWGDPRSLLGLRLGFVLLFAATTWLMYRLTARRWGARAGFAAAVWLNAIGYYGGASGLFALPDGPFAFFWLAMLDRLAAVQEQPERHGVWLVAGLAWGGALLSKYIAAALPLGVVLWLMCDTRARALVARNLRGPLLFALGGLIAFSPTLGWNAVHGWVSFAFQGGRAVGWTSLRPDALGLALAGLAAYLFPWMLAVLLTAAAATLRELKANPRALTSPPLTSNNPEPSPGPPTTGRPPDSLDTLLLCLAAVVIGFFLMLACVKPILPHWTMIGWLSLVPLAGRWTDRRWATHPVRTRRLLTAALAAWAVVMGVAIVQARWTPLPLGRLDPLADHVGYPQVAAQLRARGLADPDRVFWFTRRWFSAGHLALASGGDLEVTCFHDHDARGFVFWNDPNATLGRDGVLVSESSRTDQERNAYAPYFEAFEPLGRVTATQRGRVVRTLELTLFRRQLKPFPIGPRPE
ncbi:hypothetical protein Isop_0050 [Isosphaera pallida ATCC 43644]|uniref:Glycosyltransferase RgtA/B/C/D-like domain-containing protein n=1 Tax=Isosphaera pallida (strain ATCC 43644 / DSM 9630 / IS1B) TaxID=575540 RepID=E8R4Q6_ISOPI|nr:glycosyltransferase family 39 protein [Isosphaera pallida]ADV60647.1 hypothetical protein Isop_0050 [Isosphaera pallida ATCC 43644]